MYSHCVKKLGRALFAVSLAVMPLSGCSTAYFGNSSFGEAKLETASLPETGNISADKALYEARNHFRNNNFGYSAAYYKKVVQLSPDDPEGYVGLGASYDQLRRFDLSDRVYASLKRLTGDNVQYYNNLGYSHMLRGELKKAASNFRKAEAIDPYNIVVENNMRMLAKVAARART